MKIYISLTPSHEELFQLQDARSVRGVEVVEKRYDIKGTGSYCTPDYRECLNVRLDDIIRSIQENMGETIIWCDADVLFSDRFNVRDIEQAHRATGKALIFSKLDLHLDNQCWGFFSIRCCHAAVNFFKQCRRWLKGKTEEYDQIAGHHVEHQFQEHIGFYGTDYYNMCFCVPPPRDWKIAHVACRTGVGCKLEAMRHIKRLTETDTEIVAARYKEDISWVRDANAFLKVYDKGSNTGCMAPQFENLPNHGREAHTYLTHIVNNYDNLADYTIFTQANPRDHVEQLMGELLNPVKSDFNWYGNRILTDSKWGEPLYVNWRDNVEKKKLGLPFVWEELFTGRECPAEFKFKEGAIFGVSRERIRMRERAWYEKCLDLDWKKDESLGHSFERLWGTIFELV